MKYLFDLLILIVASLAVGSVNPRLGAVLLFLGFLTAAQFWRTQLLLGDFSHVRKTGRTIKAAILAVMITAFLGMALPNEPAGSDGGTVMEVLNNELFPALMLIMVLVALALCAFVTEKRKR